MSTQLDPVTGAPLLTPDLGNIDQIPYKVQPVPLADLTNQPQLGRAYLYPDDVPPVLANLNAMNGMQEDQAQTLHTDGNHNLNVNVKAGGGGGAGAIKPSKWTASQGSIHHAYSGDAIGGPLTVDRTLFVWSFSGGGALENDFAPGDTQDSFWLGFIDTNGGTTLALLMFNMTFLSYGSTFYATNGGQQTLLFPNGLDLTGIFAPTANIKLAAGGTDALVNCSALVVQ